MEKRNTNNCLHVDQNLIKRINKSIFLLHQLVIKRKEKQNKRNVNMIMSNQMSFMFAR